MTKLYQFALQKRVLQFLWRKLLFKKLEYFYCSKYYFMENSPLTVIVKLQELDRPAESKATALITWAPTPRMAGDVTSCSTATLLPELSVAEGGVHWTVAVCLPMSAVTVWSFGQVSTGGWVSVKKVRYYCNYIRNHTISQHDNILHIKVYS